MKKYSGRARYIKAHTAPIARADFHPENVYRSKKRTMLKGITTAWGGGVRKEKISPPLAAYTRVPMTATLLEWIFFNRVKNNGNVNKTTMMFAAYAALSALEKIQYIGAIRIGKRGENTV